MGTIALKRTEESLVVLPEVRVACDLPLELPFRHRLLPATPSHDAFVVAPKLDRAPRGVFREGGWLLPARFPSLANDTLSPTLAG